jgi:hypothetical protein
MLKWITTILNGGDRIFIPKIPKELKDKYDEAICEISDFLCDACNSFYEVNDLIEEYFDKHADIKSHKNNIIDVMIFKYTTLHTLNDDENKQRDRALFLLKCVKDCAN